MWLAIGDYGDELSEQQEAEILRRRDQALAHPELLEPWDGAIERERLAGSGGGAQEDDITLVVLDFQPPSQAVA